MLMFPNAGKDNAYAMYGSDSVTTGDINGTISATAGKNNAYGIASGGTLNISSINGRISAEATAGSNAFGRSSDGNMTVGDIGNNSRSSHTFCPGHKEQTARWH